MEGEVITKKDYSKSFEELYGAPRSHVYNSVIEAFFNEKNPDLRDKFCGRKDGARVHMGNIWIAHHYDMETGRWQFDTLTVEPLDGSQYEIAVRMRNTQQGDTLHSPDYMYSGYSINDHGTFRGFDTYGH